MRVEIAFSQNFTTLDCQKIHIGKNFENPHGKNLDLRVKSGFHQKNFLQPNRFYSDLEVRPKSKHFSAMLARGG